MGSPDEPRSTAFAIEFDRALDARRMTLVRLREKLVAVGSPVSVATLSYWRSGKRQPEHPTSFDALEHIEGFLGLPDRHLSRLLGPNRRRLPRSPGRFDEIVGHPGAASDFLAQLRLDEQDLVAIGGSLTVNVGPDRKVIDTVNRLVWLARADGATRGVIHIHLDEPDSPEPTLEVLGGAQRGGSVYDPDTGLFSVELILDHPLAVNETAITEHRRPASPTSTEILHGYRLVAERRVTESSLWIRFHPSALPVATECEWYEDSDSGTTNGPAKLGGRALHHIVRNFGPGGFGLRWSW